MRILVTNDDGVDSPGLHMLARIALEASDDVLVAAPHTERSGASASLTVLGDGGRLPVHTGAAQVPGLDPMRTLAVEATPAFITMVAANGAFGPPPQVVLSGINRGPNTGHAILHSGTVGAALTAATYGYRALAVSVAAATPRHWGTACEVAARALDWLLHHTPDASVLNVNVPDLPADHLRGLRPARLASYGAVQGTVGEPGENHVTMTFTPLTTTGEPGTDAALLAEGWATITALRSPCEARGVPLPGVAGEIHRDA